MSAKMGAWTGQLRRRRRSRCTRRGRCSTGPPPRNRVPVGVGWMQLTGPTFTQAVVLGADAGLVDHIMSWGSLRAESGAWDLAKTKLVVYPLQVGKTRPGIERGTARMAPRRRQQPEALYHAGTFRADSHVLERSPDAVSARRRTVGVTSRGRRLLVAHSRTRCFVRCFARGCPQRWSPGGASPTGGAGPSASAAT